MQQSHQQQSTTQKKWDEILTYLYFDNTQMRVTARVKSKSTYLYV